MNFHPKVARHSRNKNPEQILNSAFKFLCLFLPIEFIILTNATNCVVFFFQIPLKSSHSMLLCLSANLTRARGEESY